MGLPVMERPNLLSEINCDSPRRPEAVCIYIYIYTYVSVRVRMKVCVYLEESSGISAGVHRSFQQ